MGRKGSGDHRDHPETISAARRGNGAGGIERTVEQAPQHGAGGHGTRATPAGNDNDRPDGHGGHEGSLTGSTVSRGEGGWGHGGGVGCGVWGCAGCGGSRHRPPLLSAGLLPQCRVTAGTARAERPAEIADQRPTLPARPGPPISQAVLPWSPRNGEMGDHGRLGDGAGGGVRWKLPVARRNQSVETPRHGGSFAPFRSGRHCRLA